jgi:ABC-type sulfate/molybdate transport systems ATPase subunit
MGSPMLAVHELRRPGVALEAFELADGACVAARGPSCAGKTLLRALADLDPNQG